MSLSSLAYMSYRPKLEFKIRYFKTYFNSFPFLSTLYGCLVSWIGGLCLIDWLVWVCTGIDIVIVIVVVGVQKRKNGGGGCA